MNETERYINEMIMKEVGLDVGPRMRVIDQESGLPITFKGKELVAPNGLPNGEVMIFDCYKSTSLMQRVFGLFADKFEEDTGDTIDRIHTASAPGNKATMTCVTSDGKEYTSSPYARDSLRYLDLIMQINGDESPDLQKFDTEKRKTRKPIKKKAIPKDGWKKS